MVLETQKRVKSLFRITPISVPNFIIFLQTVLWPAINSLGRGGRGKGRGR